MSEITTITGVVAMSQGLAATWNATTLIIPNGVYCYETDTKKAKIADGTDVYSALPYHVGAVGSLNIGNGVENDGSGNLTIKPADSTITVGSAGISVDPTAILYVETDHGTVASGTLDLDRSVSVWHKVTVGGAFTLAIINWSATGNYIELRLQIVNGGSAVVTWPTISWVKADSSGDVVSTLSAAGITLHSTATDWVTIWSTDGGVTFYGKVLR